MIRKKAKNMDVRCLLLLLKRMPTTCSYRLTRTISAGPHVQDRIRNKSFRPVLSRSLEGTTWTLLIDFDRPKFLFFSTFWNSSANSRHVVVVVGARACLRTTRASGSNKSTGNVGVESILFRREVVTGLVWKPMYITFVPRLCARNDGSERTDE